MSNKAFLPGMQIGIVSTGVFGGYLFVGFNNALPAAEGNPVQGVAIIESEAVGDHVTVACSGRLPVLTGTDVATTNLAAGNPVTTDAAGKAILANAATDNICGRVAPGETADAADQTILIDFGREGLLT